MPSQVWRKGFLSIAGTDLSAQVRALSLAEDVEPLDDTAMGATWRSATPGLRSGVIEVEFNQASTVVDSAINAVLGSTFAVIFGRSSTGISTTYPRWSGSATIAAYSPHAGGAVGNVDIATCTIQSAGDWTRATST